MHFFTTVGRPGSPDIQPQTQDYPRYHGHQINPTPNRRKL